MTCPICHKRKAKRFCPARGDSICSVCCGTEREVTIDCPSDCPHLIASRRYDYERKEIDWEKMPFRDTKIEPSFLDDHEKAEAQHTGLGAMRDADVRDALIFLAQLGFTRSNERPKGRAFLDLLRSQLKSPELDKPASNIVLLP